MRQLFTPAERPAIVPAILQGSIFAGGFLLFATLATDVLLKLSPSTNQDDMRIDLVLPIYGGAYIATCVVSYLTGKIIFGLLRRPFTLKTHLKFALMVPLLFIVAWLLIVVGLMLSLVAHSKSELIDTVIIYGALFVSMIIGYFHVLTSTQNH